MQLPRSTLAPQSLDKSSLIWIVYNLCKIKILSNWSDSSFNKLCEFLNSLTLNPLLEQLPKSFKTSFYALGVYNPMGQFKHHIVCGKEDHIFLDKARSICPSCGIDYKKLKEDEPGTEAISLLL